MEEQYKPYHHYKGDELTPSEKVERRVVELLLNSKVPDNKRDSSVVFELKHSSECIQIARMLAQKRRLDISLAESIAALHDIYVIVHGIYKDHAKLGAPIAEKIVRDMGGFSSKEAKIISDAVAHHSEKDVYTNKPYIELIKDVDVFACSLYKNAEEEYRLSKSASLFKEYSNRVKKVRKEFNLNPNPVWRK
ncbi:MAG: HD domain-containing protein [Patescibacteria group bacterium]